MVSRTPPAEVIQQLRKEVGFGCPVQGCSNPYLTWHHFDPPWSAGHTHSPKGMIALCLEHHKKADKGAFTNEQLYNMKKYTSSFKKTLQGSFDWLRNDLLVFAGATGVNPGAIVSFWGKPTIWFNRDKNNNMLLNLDFSNVWSKDCLIMKDNLWTLTKNSIDVICPPSGHYIHVQYEGNDFIEIKFDTCRNDEQAKKLMSHREYYSISKYINFPITTVNLRLSACNGDFKVEHGYIEFPGRNKIFGGVCMFGGNLAGFGSA